MGGICTVRYGGEWYLYRLGSHIEAETTDQQENLLAGMLYQVNETEYKTWAGIF